jgi:uncharacterized protein YcfJ
MNNRILIGLATLVLGVAAASAQAGDRHRNDHDHDHDRGRGHDRDRGYADVVRVEPILERVRYSVPVEHCWNEERAYRQGPNGGAIVGGVLGGVIGSNVGRGSDRPVTTVAGAVLGAAIGSQIDRDNRDRRVRYETVRACEIRHEERWDRRVVAYRVSYVYRGRSEVVRLAYDPGRRFRVDDVRRHG